MDQYVGLVGQRSHVKEWSVTDWKDGENCCTTTAVNEVWMCYNKQVTGNGVALHVGLHLSTYMTQNTIQ